MSDIIDLEAGIPRGENPKSRKLRMTGWLKKAFSDSEAPDFVENAAPGDISTSDTHPHNMILSKTRHTLDFGGNDHYPVIDLDGPVRVVPSSTIGHYHLFIDKTCSWDDYIVFLKAAERIGLLEPGYVRASIARGYTCAFIQEY